VILQPIAVKYTTQFTILLITNTQSWYWCS